MSPSAAPAPWRDRIVGHGEEAPDQLLANPRNWRIHPKAQQAALGSVLDRVGWVAGVLVNRTTGHLVDGHLRVELALSRGEPTVPVAYLELTEEEEALVLASLDPLAAMAATDSDKLRELLAEITIGNSDLEAMLRSLAPEPKVGLTDPDDVPEVPDEPYVKPGELWLLGDHRLLCGDATSADDVARLMGTDHASMMFTDPPWNVAIGQDSNPRHRQRAGLRNDDLSATDFTAFLASFASLAAPLVDGDVYCVLGAAEWPTLDLTLRGTGLHWSATIIWVKDQFVLGRSKYHRRYEPIWYGWRASGTSSFGTDRSLDDVWEIPRPRRSDEHPTMKPVELVERAIVNSSRANAIVLDPFVGSGTTIIAAEQVSRRCYAMEIEPRYVQVAIERWQAFTGREAVRG